MVTAGPLHVHMSIHTPEEAQAIRGLVNRGLHRLRARWCGLYKRDAIVCRTHSIYKKCGSSLNGVQAPFTHSFTQVSTEAVYDMPECRATR
jgi:hypothetical protein